jgi:hypothetical protein
LSYVPSQITHKSIQFTYKFDTNIAQLKQEVLAS